MKKQFTFLLILVFVLGLVPINFSTAITQNQIDAEVQIVCTDGAGSWFSGSGTIIDPKGIILTNRHVVEGAYMNTCVIGFIESINQEPNFGTTGNYNLAEVKYYTTTDDTDAAILYLDNPTNKTYPYINIWNSNSNGLQLGEKIETIGFPSIGGSTITYTSGDFSGFGGLSDNMQNYLKTTATLEHGNSGGAAYNSAGNFIGIPTGVVVGPLGSLGYILSVDSIKNWLANIIGDNYQNKVTEENNKVTVTENIAIEEDLTPPYLNSFHLGFYAYNDQGSQVNGRDITSWDITTIIDPWKNLKFYWYEDCDHDECINDKESNIKGYYYYFGKNANAIPREKGKYITSNQLIKTTINDKLRKYTYDSNGNWTGSYYVSATRVQLPEIINISGEGDYYFILQAVDENNNISNNLINFEYVYEGMDYKEIKAIEIFDPNKNKIGEATMSRSCIDSAGTGLTPLEIYTKYTKLYIKPDYGYPTNGIIGLIIPEFYKDKNGELKGNDCSGTEERCAQGKVYSDNFIEWNLSDGDLIFTKPYQSGRTGIFSVKHQVIKIKHDINKSKAEKISGCAEGINYTTVERNPIDTSLINRLKGQILLQVESNGEAYYIFPDDGKKYYLGRPADAFSVMRQLGLGATHDFINSHTIFPNSVSGKILLDVEQNGEAYYIYPKDNKAYYLGRPADAFRIMRELGLGITNSDLNKIPVGSL